MEKDSRTLKDKVGQAGCQQGVCLGLSAQGLEWKRQQPEDAVAVTQTKAFRGRLHPVLLADVHTMQAQAQRHWKPVIFPALEGLATEGCRSDAPIHRVWKEKWVPNEISTASDWRSLTNCLSPLDVAWTNRTPKLSFWRLHIQSGGWLENLDVYSKLLHYHKGNVVIVSKLTRQKGRPNVAIRW